MNLATLRLRYTQFLITGILAVSLYVMSQSLANGISQFDDHLWGKEALISTFNQLKLKLGDRVISKVLVGKEGWLDYTGFGNLDGYQNAFETSPEELQNTVKKLQKLYKELKKRNITLLLVIAPNKATIYPDKLPDEIQKLGPRSKLDVLTDYMQQSGPPIMLDLRPALLEGRKKQEIYYKTDTHWNQYGAFIGYTEIMKALSKTYRQLTPKRIEDFELTTQKPYLHDLPRYIGATHMLETGVVISPKENDAHLAVLNNDALAPLQIYITQKKNSPTILMYVDSFGIKLKDFFPPQFSKSTFIVNTSEYPDALSLTTIDIIKPNIVVVEMVERSFNIRHLDDFLKQLLSRRN